MKWATAANQSKSHRFGKTGLVQASLSL